ncbi:MAG: FkbM family methyltransferase [Deltaproteobacteria bacterium]|nr:FkbM family methyltransferase [Deltaproteobacteria bacterium]MCL5276187.1 FkbM family methyltransferase [Deltaproteobacteria bacterium]
MNYKYKFYLANLLYKYAVPVYRMLYFVYKKKTDAYEISLLKKWLHPGVVVFDIGANIGFYSVLLSKLAGGNGVVHCFEHDRTNMYYLQKEIRHFPNIVLNKKAVSDTAKTLKLYTSNRINVVHRTYPVKSYGTTYEVEAVSIDEYVNQKYKVDFIKMDIQGSEFFALRGMAKTLELNPDIIVLTELWPAGLKEAGVDIKEMINFIFSLHFKIFLIEEDKLKRFSHDILNDTGFREKDPDSFYNIIITQKELINNE